MGNSYEELEQELAGLQVKCDLLGIVVHRTVKSIWTTHDNICISFNAIPQVDYDPWAFEIKVLNEAIKDVTQGVTPRIRVNL